MVIEGTKSVALKAQQENMQKGRGSGLEFAPMSREQASGCSGLGSFLAVAVP